jgi:hypothetical protein
LVAWSSSSSVFLRWAALAAWCFSSSTAGAAAASATSSAVAVFDVYVDRIAGGEDAAQDLLGEFVDEFFLQGAFMGRAPNWGS